MNINAVTVSVIAFIFVVRHVLYSPVKILADLVSYELDCPTLSAATEEPSCDLRKLPGTRRSSVYEVVRPFPRQNPAFLN
jgi:hypothetical protein